MEIKGKTSLITGGTAGIGLAIAEILAQNGCNLILSYFHNVENAQKIKNQLGSYGVFVEIIKSNTGNPEDRKNLIQQCEKIGKIDFLVNNSGSTMPDLDGKESRTAMFEHHLMSTVYFSEWFAEQLGSDEGVVINISSVLGVNPFAWYKGVRLESYCCIKTAVNQYTKISANKYSEKIRVNAIAPGNTETSAWDNADLDLIKNRIGGTSIARFVKAEEIAQTALHIIENNAINGQILVVDGGVVARGYERI